MTALFLPLMNLRISLQNYLDKPDTRNNKKYSRALEAILDMHIAMTDFMLSSKDDSILRRYMHTWQEQIRLLFDEIPSEWTENMDLRENDPNPLDPNDPKYNICFECFRLIKEMQLQYPTFFDENCFPPIMFKHLEKSRHKSKWLFISKSVRRKMDGKFEVVWEIIESYLAHLWDPNHRFTYREISYASNFINQLMYNIQAKGDAFDIDALFSFLIYLNFNDVEFVHHMTLDIIDEMDEMILDYEKTALLQRIQIQLDATNVRLDCILDPGNPPINVMLSKWIRKELELLTI